MSEGRPRVSACSAEGLQRSLSLDRVGSARTLMSGYCMVRFSASIPLSSSAASAMTTCVREGGGNSWASRVGFLCDFFYEVFMGEHVRSVRGVPRTFTSSGNGKFHNSFTRNSQFPGCSSLLSRWSSRRSDARPRHRICTSRRARRPIRAIRSASRSTTSTSRGWCRGTSTSRPCTRTRWCWSRTARRGAAAGPIRPCRPSVPSSRREAATSCSRSSCRGCLTNAGGR